MRRATYPLLAATAACVLLGTSAARAQDSTRIQLVAKIPPVSLSVSDASGVIAGEVDGIATDSMAGASPGETLLGAQLHLSIPGAEGSVSWGHRDGSGNFVAGQNLPEPPPRTQISDCR